MGKLKGFMGTILEINLTTNEIKKVPLDETIAEKFLGGGGYAIATLMNLIDKNTDPLGPENILFFMTGPLLGSPAVCTGRMVVCAKSPITGLIGESNSGTFAARPIKLAGYDGIMIKGASSKPVYITISDDNIEIKDATHLWGKKIYETHEILKQPKEWEQGKVICIGPAGENMVKYSIIASEERAFGRLGMGAVMGSKKLKAIIIKGTKKIEFAKPEELKALAKEVSSAVMDIYTNQVMGGLGTSSNMNLYVLSGELPVKYHRSSDFPDVDSISGATLAEKYLKKQRHCYSCPVGCGRVVAVDNAKELGLPEGEFEGPEYETMAGYGSLMENKDLKAIIKANYLCNDYGLDTISSSGAIALLMDLIDRKIITAQDIDGIDLKWGDMDNVYKLIEMISLRKGIGDVLAEGSNAVGKRFNVDPEQIATIMCNEVPYHDARSSFGMAIAYSISPTYGASHCLCDMYMTSLGQAWDELEINSIPAQENSKEMAIASARLQEYRAFGASIVQCVFGNPQSTSNFAKLVEYATGIPFDLQAVKDYGRRILNLKRLANIKFGLTPAKEKMPKILLTPLPGGTNGNVPDMDLLTSEFYKYEQWDPVTGMPSPEIIEKYGLSEYAKF